MNELDILLNLFFYALALFFMYLVFKKLLEVTEENKILKAKIEEHAINDVFKQAESHFKQVEIELAKGVATDLKPECEVKNG